MQFSPVVFSGMFTLAVLVAGVFVVSVVRAAPARTPRERRGLGLRVTLLTLAWMTAFGLAAASGRLSAFDRPPLAMGLMMVASVGGGVVLGLSRVGAWLATLPLAWLVGWQAFRLPLELVMHRAADEGLMPEVMSFYGYNFDIVTGATALALGLWLARAKVPRLVVVLWNVLGTLLLLNILTVALLATPFIRAFGDTQLNTWVTFFPYVWLPGVLVLSAVMGHIVVARRLLAERRGELPEGPAKKQLIEA